jgi:hypothetical protein
MLSAEEMLGPNVTRLLCLHHLKCNFIQRWRWIHLSSFWRIANSTIDAEYQQAVQQLYIQHPRAADYLQSVNISRWVTVYIPDAARRRCGQRTSNAAEQLNAILRNPRQLPIIEL